MVNKRLRQTVLDIVDNQVRLNDPAITKATLARLQGSGYSKLEAKEKIAAVVIEEIYDVMKNGEEFDEKRFTDKLKALK